jgi:FixJ family two-component response regulator
VAQVPVISIIDDDESVRVATRRFVRSLGYVGHVFASADEFLRSPLVDDTKCVIADVQMPGMSGIELQSVLTARGNDTPMIFITAYPEEGIRTRALEGGAVCFLSKPFDGPTLVKCLALALQRRATRPCQFATRSEATSSKP